MIEEVAEHVRAYNPTKEFSMLDSIISAMTLNEKEALLQRLAADLYLSRRKHRMQDQGAALVDFIYRNCTKRGFDVTDIASEFSVSQRTVYKVAKDNGILIRDVINEARVATFIKLAAANPNEKIICLAMDAGFGDVSGMYRTFKAVKGMSPSAYFKSKK